MDINGISDHILKWPRSDLKNVKFGLSEKPKTKDKKLIKKKINKSDHFRAKDQTGATIDKHKVFKLITYNRLSSFMSLFFQIAGGKNM